MPLSTYPFKLSNKRALYKIFAALGADDARALGHNFL